MRVLRWLIAAIPLLLFACNVKDYNKVDLYSEFHRVQAVIEIPAGTSHHIQYCGMTRRFNFLTGKEDANSTRFLPFPFNIGFIPSTMQMENSDGSGQNLDVLILSETLQTGNITEILPIGIINVKKEYSTSRWIVAVPYDKVIRVVSAENLADLNSQYAGIVRIIEEWLCYADPSQKTEILSWQDEVMAMKFIQTMAVNYNN